MYFGKRKKNKFWSLSERSKVDLAKIMGIPVFTLETITPDPKKLKKLWKPVNLLHTKVREQKDTFLKDKNGWLDYAVNNNAWSTNKMNQKDVPQYFQRSNWWIIRDILIISVRIFRCIVLNIFMFLF